MYMILYAVSVIGFALTVYISSLRQSNEGNMEWRSFLFGKIAFLVSPDQYPANNSESAFQERQKVQLLTTKLFYPLDNLLEPKIGAVAFTDINIPVTPQPDAFTQQVQDTIMARVYTPRNKSTQLRPVLVWYHGGGWVIGSAKGDHIIAAQLAVYSDYIIVNVDYRLAPNFPFPSPPNDCYEALQWVSDHIADYGGDASQIIVAGESAGGNLAAAMVYKSLLEEERSDCLTTTTSETQPVCSSQKLRGKIVASLLVSAALDSHSAPTEFDFAFGAIRAKSGAWFRQLYQGGPGWTEEVRSDPLFAPLHTPTHLLQHFPPTVFIGAGYDGLTKENQKFADILTSLDRQVSWTVYPSTIHWFYGKSFISKFGTEALRQSVKELEQLLRPKNAA